jgi:hypothetical protein
LSVPDGSTEAELPVKLSWKIPPRPEETELQATLARLDATGNAAQVVTQSTVTLPAQADQGALSVVLKNPGQYEWRVLHADGTPLEPPAAARFSVSPDFQGIQLMSPSVAGSHVTDNQPRTRDLLPQFKLRLEWKPFKGARSYTLVFGNQKIASNSTFWIEPNQKIIQGRIPYQVSTQLPSGFKVTSKPSVFVFSFLSPPLVTPTDGTRVSLSHLDSNLRKEGMLFTWQRTSFTGSYDFQVSADPNFARGVVNKPVRDNFAVVRGFKPGTYYWRVRSVGEGATSAYGKAFRVIVTP